MRDASLVRSLDARALVLHAAGLVLAAGTAAAIATVSLGPKLFSIAFVTALGHAVFLGLPIYLVLRRRGRPPWWAAPLGGFAAGTVPIGLLALVSGADQASIGNVATVVNGVRTFAGWLEYLTLVLGAGGLGAAGGLAFGVTVQSTLPPGGNGGVLPPTRPNSRRLVVDLSVVSLAAVVVLTAIYLPGALEDKSCHNPMRGRVSLESQINVNIAIGRGDWPAFTHRLQSFALTRGWSYRGDVRPGSDYPWLQISICDEGGTEIAAQYAPGLPGIFIDVYQPQGGASWRQPFAALYQALEMQWPGRLSFAGDHGQTIPAPAWLGGAPAKRH